MVVRRLHPAPTLCCNVALFAVSLASYTRDNAWVEFAEARKGMLRAGYLADLVLLDGDIEAAPKDAIRELQVRTTVCDGRVTYEAG